MPGMRLVNRLCTASKALMSLTNKEFHTTQQYSTIGSREILNLYYISLMLKVQHEDRVCIVVHR